MDPRLRITFSPWAIDPFTSYPIIDAVTGNPIPFAAQHLWVRNGEGRWNHIDTFPMETGGFQHLNCRYLEINKQVTETRSAGAIYRLMAERNSVQRELEKRRHLDWRQQRAKANQKRIGDLVFNGVSGRRQAKPFSYSGQTVHSTPGDILRDAREDGWVLE